MIKKIKELITEILYFFIIKTNKFPEVKSFEETIEEIIENKKSICRFGDGEIGLIKNEGVGFQKSNLELGKRLEEVFVSDDEKVLIAIPNIFKKSDLIDTVEVTEKFWKKNLILNLKEYKKLNSKKIYYNAFISRPYIRYKDKSNAKEKFDLLKKIWNEKDIVFVEGTDTKLGIGNDLFDNAQSIERIICPSQNAFDVYKKIYDKCIEIPKNKIFIIALGPTATVLAFDLANLGYQAIDLGHLDIEYEWFKKGVDQKVQIDGKFTNEVQNGNNVNEIIDENYEKQIICKILE